MAPVHKYKVGEQLDLLPAAGRTSMPADTCTVLGLMPNDESSPRYRVQSLSERHQRIVKETDLRTPVRSTPNDLTA
jgi:hypothetical protein